MSAEANLSAMRKAVAEGKPVVRIEDERTLANLEQRAQEMREQMKDFEQRFTPAYMELKANVQTVKRNLQRVEASDRRRSDSRRSRRPWLRPNGNMKAPASRRPGCVRSSTNTSKR